MNGYLPTSAVRKAGITHAWVDLLKAFADPVRQRILALLQLPPAELSVGEICDILKLPQSTVSRHLKTLAEWQLVAIRPDGTAMMYRLGEASQQAAVKTLLDLATSAMHDDPAARHDAARLITIIRRREANKQRTFVTPAPEWEQIRAAWFGETFHIEAMVAGWNPAWVVGDLGTGTGLMLPILAPHVNKIIAVEIAEDMLLATQQRVHAEGLTNVEVRRGSLDHLPIEDASLDVALVQLVLVHVADPLLALRQAARALKPNGVLIVVDLQPHEEKFFMQKMGHRCLGFTPEQIRQWLTEAGFSQTRWHGLPARHWRAPETDIRIPDLFVVRAVRTAKILPNPTV